jgi:uncharacterized protein
MTTLPVGLKVGLASIDRDLATEIERIKLIDNHNHALGASPVESEPQENTPSDLPFTFPFRLRLDNPEYVEAWRSLWADIGEGSPNDVSHKAVHNKWRRRKELGDGYPSWVLDQAGIEVAFVNAERLERGQLPPRFQWVPYAGELLFPIASESSLLQVILDEAGLATIPDTLAGYTSQVILPTLRRWSDARIKAIKLALAYRRPLAFESVKEGDAAQIYADASASVPSGETYRVLQDYLFHELCREAGQLGLVIHIHTGVGANPYFNIAGSRPSLLEPALNEPGLRDTRIVLIHGGWPYEREAGVMLLRPNIYADFSAQTFLRSTHALAGTLREWLEWYPEKVLFGTDAYADEMIGLNSPLTGWEEKIWLGARTAREALGLALTGMMRDGQLTRAQALDIANLVMRGNAQKLYGL